MAIPAEYLETKQLQQQNRFLSKFRQSSYKIVKSPVSIRFHVICVSMFMVVAYNQRLLSEVAEKSSGNSLNVVFLISFVVSLLAIFSLLQSLINYKSLYKPIMSIVFIGSASATYFADTYGTIYDSTMMRNLIETDTAETLELMCLRFALYILFLGVVPSLLLFKCKFKYSGMVRQVVHNVGVFCLSLCVLLGSVFAFYGTYTSLLRTHKEIRYMITPANYIYSLGVALSPEETQREKVIMPLGRDAQLITPWQQRGKKNLIVLVVGETARAANFSLYGYPKQTNQQLEKHGVLAWSQYTSCGTATAISLPCMFSIQARSEYKAKESKSTENVLDVLTHAGVKVVWRENNSGCKGICERVESEDLHDAKSPVFCNKDECFDEILLDKIDDHLTDVSGDTVIVLHQKGSHGPAYHKRYPAAFEKFTPTCKTTQLNQCTKEELANTYDNTLVYTDHFLGEVITKLKSLDQDFNTSMIYVSDHGESLGESNLYLHGLPYAIAPDEQKQVPFVAWFSEEFTQQNKLDESCIRKTTDKEFSHDNLFHSLLGVTGVSTSVYDSNLDMFSTCKG